MSGETMTESDMPELTPLFPRQRVPQLAVPTLDGDVWRIGDASPQNFSLIVIYRGLHCPICRPYLSELQRQLPEFEKRGVEVIAISSDGEDRARRAREEWRLDTLRIGHSLDLSTARQWGLYVSASIGVTSTGIEEPPLFVEPGLFLVRPDSTLYFAAVQTMPFARPHFADLVKGLDMVLARNYPARGEVVDLRQAAE
jgi:peroxiredoxin